MMPVALDIISDDIAESLGHVQDDAVEQSARGMLKNKPYDISTMSDEELRGAKYCLQCKDIVNTLWVLSDNSADSDEKDSSPDLAGVKPSRITGQYVATHDVSEQCAKCLWEFKGAKQ